jgi:hypothetical protein
LREDKPASEVRRQVPHAKAGATKVASRCLTHGAVKIDRQIVNPMAWAARTVDNQ